MPQPPPPPIPEVPTLAETAPPAAPARLEPSRTSPSLAELLVELMLITALAGDSQWGRPIAVRIYAKARPLYHPVTAAGLDKLGLAPAK